MKLKDSNGNDAGTVQLPEQFEEPVRDDIIKRAVLSRQSKDRQDYGAKPNAGQRHSDRISKKRRDYRGSYGYGISRVPRKIMSRRGRRMNWEGATIPGTVGGRRAHPPTAEKDWTKEINDQERYKALRSALNATLEADLAEERGHITPDDYPFAVTGVEDIQKTGELHETLRSLGLGDELDRAAQKRQRSGKGKGRGRKRKYRTSVLIVVSGDVDTKLAGRNIPGVDVEEYDDLDTELLAPGTQPGRLSIFTEEALGAMRDDGVYL